MKSSIGHLVYSIADQDFEHTKSVGILNVSVNLLRQIADDPAVERLTVFSNPGISRAMQLGDRAVVVDHRQPVASRAGRIYWDQSRIYSRARHKKADVLMIAKGYSPILRKPPCPTAVILYDAMHDHYRKHYPDAVSTFENRYFTAGWNASLRHASVIFTISDFTTSEVHRIAGELGITPPPVYTMGIGFDATDPQLTHLNPDAEKDGSVILLASPWPHKQTVRAVEYIRRIQRDILGDRTIHVVGRLPESLRLPDDGSWVAHPRLDNPSYARLLSSASAVVFFSEYEGFGMPPVETLMAGAAPVYADIPVTREVMVGRGFPFSLRSPEGFATAMEGALSASPVQLGAWRDALLDRHTWDRACGVVRDGLCRHT